MKLQVTPTGFSSECSCPAFPKINGHCKHVAALLIALRDQVRPKQPRPEARRTAARSLPGVGRPRVDGSQGPRGLPHRPGRLRRAASAAVDAAWAAAIVAEWIAARWAVAT